MLVEKNIAVGMVVVVVLIQHQLHVGIRNISRFFMLVILFAEQNYHAQIK